MSGSSLLFPALLKIEEHIPCNWTFKTRMDVMPWLPRSTILDIVSLGEIWLMEILAVNSVESAEEWVMLGIVATKTEINTSHKAYDSSLF